MADRYVRIYDGRHPETAVIGASMSASNAVRHERVHAFLTERGYEYRKLPLHPIFDPETDKDEIRRSIPKGTTSWFHLEVRPPLSPEDTQAFGALVASLVDPYHNSGFLIDHRQESPTSNQVIREW